MAEFGSQARPCYSSSLIGVFDPVFQSKIHFLGQYSNDFTFKCCFQALHASMQQRQRLKSLERFSSNPRAVLLATDVAARGLDIPDIEHVIHYQVPRTAEVSSRYDKENQLFSQLLCFYLTHN